jgi:hypothetical protein
VGEEEIWREYEQATQEPYESLVAACAPHRAEANRQIEAIWQGYKAQTDPLITAYRSATAPQRAEMERQLTVIYKSKGGRASG